MRDGRRGATAHSYPPPCKRVWIRAGPLGPSHSFVPFQLLNQPALVQKLLDSIRHAVIARSSIDALEPMPHFRAVRFQYDYEAPRHLGIRRANQTGTMPPTRQIHQPSEILTYRFAGGYSPRVQTLANKIGEPPSKYAGINLVNLVIGISIIQVWLGDHWKSIGEEGQFTAHLQNLSLHAGHRALSIIDNLSLFAIHPHTPSPHRHPRL